MSWFLVSDNSRDTYRQSKFAKGLYWINFPYDITITMLFTCTFKKCVAETVCVIFSFPPISSKPTNGWRSFLPNSSHCLTLDNNSFSKGFSLYCNCIYFTSSEKHETEFHVFNIYVAFSVATVSFAIKTSPFSWIIKQPFLLNKTIFFSYNAVIAEYFLTSLYLDFTVWIDN